MVFYYLLGDLALMELALQKFAIDNLIKKGFMLTEVPLMLRRKPYEGVVALQDFKDVMYKIEGEKVTRTHPTCERCGTGYFMGDHKDRYTCGHCGLTRYKTH